MNTESNPLDGLVLRAYLTVLTLFVAAAVPPERAGAVEDLASALSRPPVVEVEEDVYSFEPANNGAGPSHNSQSRPVGTGEDPVGRSRTLTMS